MCSVGIDVRAINISTMSFLCVFVLSFNNHNLIFFLLESLTEYVTVMVCVVVDGEPKIGVIYKPFSKEMGEYVFIMQSCMLNVIFRIARGEGSSVKDEII